MYSPSVSLRSSREQVVPQPWVVSDLGDREAALGIGVETAQHQLDRAARDRALEAGDVAWVERRVAERRWPKGISSMLYHSKWCAPADVLPLIAC